MEKLPTPKLVKRSPKSIMKKNPLKVVYISNPMKIKATPSEFRAVVQQFTGRYATSPPPGLAGAPVRDHHHKQEEVGCAGGGVQLNMADARLTTGSDLSHESDHQVLDDLIVTPQMLESFPPMFPQDFGS